MAGEHPFGRRDYDGTGVLTYKWLATVIGSIVAVVVVGLLVLVYQGNTQTVLTLDLRVNQVMAGQATSNAELAAVKAQQLAMERQLARIEAKVDNLIERRP